MLHIRYILQRLYLIYHTSYCIPHQVVIWYHSDAGAGIVAFNQVLVGTSAIVWVVVM